MNDHAPRDDAEHDATTDPGSGDTTAITVALTRQPYDVHIGRGLLGRIHDLAGLAEHTRVLVVTQPPVARHHLQPVLEGLRDADHRVEVVEVPDGEGAKSPEMIASLWSAAAGIPLSRRDCVVALGGGVVGDLAGFLAATWNRGIDVVQVPTSVLAQVDAAVGGKTGINLTEGKNLVGAFHQPRTVVADVDTLATLPLRARREGLAEVVKAGLLADERILRLLEDAPAPVDGPADERLVELIRRAVAVKADVVATDEREHGRRAFLNLGHTVAHAVETVAGYGAWLHGEAVSAGLVAALRLGERLGTTPSAVAGRAEALLAHLGLPTRLPPMDRQAVWQVMARDKKAERGVRFVLLEDLGRAVLTTPDRADVDAVIDELTDESLAEEVA